MKILVTGKDGLVGSALSAQRNNNEFFFVNRRECDLTKEQEVDSLFRIIKPDAVIHAAGKVGGIKANLDSPADFYYQNTLINTNVVNSAYKHGVKKLLALSSICVFSGKDEVLKEENMQKDEPYQAEFSYGFSKRGLDIHIRSLGVKNYSSLILTNIFGMNDYYNLNNAHVIPSLINKMSMAKRNNLPLKVWGSGKAKREFLYANDLAKTIYKIIELDNIPNRILISNNNEISIKEVVEHLCEIANFTGEIVWETDKPEGQKRRIADLSVLNSLVKMEYTDFKEALAKSYHWFDNNYPNVRM
jgi:GDP-L-fucose synthase